MSRFNKGVNRRRFLHGSAAAAAGFTFATSQTYAGGRYQGGSKYFRAQTGTVPTPREETVVINMGETTVYDSFNPYVPNGESITYGVHQLAREAFYIQNFMTGEVVPWLAASHEYNDDFTEVTITLKDGITWNDGKPYTTDDVIFSFDMMRDNEELYGSSSITALAGYEAVDPVTLKIQFENPSPRWVLNNLSASDWSQWLRIVPKHIWEGQDPNTFKNENCVFSGPYTLVEARFDQRYYLWEKREDYWNTEYTFAPKYVMYRQSTGADATVQEFLRAGVDVPGMDPLNQQAIVGTYDKAVQASYADPCPRGLTPNHMGAFDSPEARWALSYLIDRETIASTIWYPPTTPAVYPWPNWPGNDKWSIPELQEQYNLNEYNPEKAAELLDSIGITMDGDKRKKNGEDLLVQMISPIAVGGPEYEIGRMVADAAQSIGLDMQVVNLQSATYGDAVRNGEYDVESNWLCLGLTDPARTYSQPWYPEEGTELPPLGTRIETDNTMRANIPEFEEINERLQTVSPDDVENPVYREALELFYKELPVIPTVQTLYPFVFNTTYWSGWPDDGAGVLSTPKHDLQPFILTLANLQPIEG